MELKNKNKGLTLLLKQYFPLQPCDRFSDQLIDLCVIKIKKARWSFVHTVHRVQVNRAQNADHAVRVCYSLFIMILWLSNVEDMLSEKFKSDAKVCGLSGCWLAKQANSDHMECILFFKPGSHAHICDMWSPFDNNKSFKLPATCVITRKPHFRKLQVMCKSCANHMKSACITPVRTYCLSCVLSHELHIQ